MRPEGEGFEITSEGAPISPNHLLAGHATLKRGTEIARRVVALPLAG